MKIISSANRNLAYELSKMRHLLLANGRTLEEARGRKICFTTT